MMVPHKKEPEAFPACHAKVEIHPVKQVSKHQAKLSIRTDP